MFRGEGSLVNGYLAVVSPVTGSTYEVKATHTGRPVFFAASVRMILTSLSAPMSSTRNRSTPASAMMSAFSAAYARNSAAVYLAVDEPLLTTPDQGSCVMVCPAIEAAMYTGRSGDAARSLACCASLTARMLISCTLSP